MDILLKVRFCYYSFGGALSAPKSYNAFCSLSATYFIFTLTRKLLPIIPMSFLPPTVCSSVRSSLSLNTSTGLCSGGGLRGAWGETYFCQELNLGSNLNGESPAAVFYQNSWPCQEVAGLNFPVSFCSLLLDLVKINKTNKAFKVIWQLFLSLQHGRSEFQC